mgnify:CR=1 FL=1
MNRKNKTNILTKRELEILYLLIEGQSNRQIAKDLIISIHTVKAHIESIYRKFGVHNKVQAAIYAVHYNMIDINKL